MTAWGLFAADDFEGFHAVHNRHFYIHDDDGRFELAGFFDGFPPVFGEIGAVAGFADNFLDEAANAQFVVDNEDTVIAAHGCLLPALAGRG
jgi:hypothetical protein